MEVLEEPAGEHGEGPGVAGDLEENSPAETCDSVIDLSDGAKNGRQAKERIFSFCFFFFPLLSPLVSRSGKTGNDIYTAASCCPSGSLTAPH